MVDHPALQSGRTAVITGGASGIGLAAATRFASLGLRVVLADLSEASLSSAADSIAEAVPGESVEILTVQCDVSNIAEVERLRDRAFEAFGSVDILLNNAGVGHGGGPFSNYEAWQKTLATNLWGVINGVQAFTQRMVDQGTDALIVNTGSKQGITCPPGDTAYNVSKAGVKVLTEGLQHELRNIPGCNVSAHLLVPGWTHTGLTAAEGTPKPNGAWWPVEVIDYLIEAVERGDFYIICPDNEVTSEMDSKRIAWAAGDIAENRPPLSRWHPDYQDAFARYLET